MTAHTSRLAPVALAAATAITGFALCGCGSSPAASQSSPSSAVERTLDAFLQLARCARTHGLSGFPDPIIRDGEPTFPNDAPRVPPQVEQECATIAARIPARYTTTQPVPSSDLQQLRRLARCIRAHGVPDWPDPNALGEFPIDARLQGGNGATKIAVESAARACARVNPDPTAGLNVVAARP